MAENGSYSEQFIRRYESSKMDPNFHGSNPFSGVPSPPKTGSHLRFTRTYSATGFNCCPCRPTHTKSDRKRLGSSMSQPDLGHAPDGPLFTEAYRMSVYERQLHFEHIRQKRADQMQHPVMNHEQFYETHFVREEPVTNEVGVKRADEFNHSYCAPVLNSDLWPLYPEQIASGYGRESDFSCTANTTCRSSPSPEANRFCKAECNRSRSLDRKRKPSEHDASSFCLPRTEIDYHFCKRSSCGDRQPEYPVMDTCIPPWFSIACRQSLSTVKTCDSLLHQRLNRPDSEPSVFTIQSKPPHSSRSQSLPVKYPSGSRKLSTGSRRPYAVTYIYNPTLASAQTVMVNDQRRSVRGQPDPYPDIGVPSTYEVFYPFASSAELNGYLTTPDSTKLQSIPTCESETRPVDEFEGQCLSYKVISNKLVSAYKMEQGYSVKMTETTHRQWFCGKLAAPSSCSSKFAQFSKKPIRAQKSPCKVVRPVSPAKIQAREQLVGSFMRITDKEVLPKPGLSTTHTKLFPSSPVEEHPVKCINEINTNKPPSRPIELNPTPNMSPKSTKQLTHRSSEFTTASAQSIQSAPSRRTTDKSVRSTRTVETSGEPVFQTNFGRKPQSLSLLVHESMSSLHVSSKDDYRDLVQHAVAAVFSAPPLYHWGSIVLPNSLNIPRMRQPPEQLTSDIARISANMNPMEAKVTALQSSSTEPPSPYSEITYMDAHQPKGKPTDPSDTSAGSVPVKLQPSKLSRLHSPQDTQTTEVTDTDRLTAPQGPLPQDIPPVDPDVIIKDAHKPSEPTHTFQSRSPHSRTVEEYDVSTLDYPGVPSADAHRIHGASSPLISSPVSKTPKKLNQRKPSPTESDTSLIPTENSITHPDSRQRTPDNSEPSGNFSANGPSANSSVVKPPSPLQLLSKDATPNAVIPSTSPKLSNAGSEPLADEEDTNAQPPSNEPAYSAGPSKVDSDEVFDSTIPQTTSKPLEMARQSPNQSVDKNKLTSLTWPSTSKTKSPEKPSSAKMMSSKKAPPGTIYPGSVEEVDTSSLDYPGVPSADGHRTYGASSPLMSSPDSKTFVKSRTQKQVPTEIEDSLINTDNSATRPDSRLYTPEHSEPATNLSIGAPSSTLLLSESTFRPQTLDIKTTPIISPKSSEVDTTDKEETFTSSPCDLQTPSTTIVNMNLNTRNGSLTTNPNKSLEPIGSPDNPTSRIPSTVSLTLSMRPGETASSSFGSRESVSFSKKFLTPIRRVEELESSSISYPGVPSTNAHRIRGTNNPKQSDLTVPLLSRHQLSNKISTETMSDENKQNKPTGTTQSYYRTHTGTGSRLVPPATGKQSALTTTEFQQSMSEQKLIKQPSFEDATGPSTQDSLRLPLHELPALSVIEHPSDRSDANAIQLTKNQPISAPNQLSDAHQSAGKPNSAQQPVVDNPEFYSNESSDVSSVDPMMTMSPGSLSDRSNGSNGTPTRSSHQKEPKMSRAYATHERQTLSGECSPKPVRNSRSLTPVGDRNILRSNLANVTDNQSAQLQTDGNFWTTPIVRAQRGISQISSDKTSVRYNLMERKRNAPPEHSASFRLSDEMTTAERMSKLKSSPLHSVVLNDVIVAKNEMHRTHADTRRSSAFKRKVRDPTAEFSRSLRSTDMKIKRDVSQSPTSLASEMLSADKPVYALKANDLLDESINQPPRSQPDWDDSLLSSDLSIEQEAANTPKNKQDDIPMLTNVTKLLKSPEKKEIQISSHLSSTAQQSDRSNPTPIITDEYQKANLNSIARQTMENQLCSRKNIKTPNINQSEDKQKFRKIAAGLNVHSPPHYHMSQAITNPVIKRSPSKIFPISKPPYEHLSEGLQASTRNELSKSAFADSGPIISTERKQQEVLPLDYKQQGRSVHSTGKIYNPTESNASSPNTRKLLPVNENMIPSTTYHPPHQADGNKLARPALSHAFQVSDRPSLRGILTERSPIHHESPSSSGTSSPSASKLPFERHMSTVADSSTIVHPTSFVTHAARDDGTADCSLPTTDESEPARPALAHAFQVSDRPSLHGILTERSPIHHESPSSSGTSSPSPSKLPFGRHMSTVTGSSTIIHPTSFEGHVQKSMSMLDFVRSSKPYETSARFSCKSLSTDILQPSIYSLPVGEVPSPSSFEMNEGAMSTTEMLEGGKDHVQYPHFSGLAFGSEMRHSSPLPEKANLTACLQNPVGEHSSVQGQYPVDSRLINLSKSSLQFPLREQQPPCKSVSTSTNHVGFAQLISPEGQTGGISGKKEYSTSPTNEATFSIPDPAVAEKSITGTCKCNRCCTVVEQDLVIITSPGGCICEPPGLSDARYQKGCVHTQNSTIPVLQSNYPYHHDLSPVGRCEVVPSSGQTFPSPTARPLTTVFIENCSICHHHCNPEDNNNMIPNLSGGTNHLSSSSTQNDSTNSHPASQTTSVSNSKGADTMYAHNLSLSPDIVQFLPVEPMDIIHMDSNENTDWEFFEEKQSEQSENTVYLSKRSSVSSGSTYHLAEVANFVNFPDKEESTEMLNKNNCCDPEVNFKNTKEEDDEYDKYCSEDSQFNTRVTHRNHTYSRFSHCLKVPVPHTEDQQTCHRYKSWLGDNSYHDDGYFLAPIIVQRHANTSRERVCSRRLNILEDRPISTSPQSSQFKKSSYLQHSNIKRTNCAQLRHQMHGSLSRMSGLSGVGFRRDRSNQNMCSTSAFLPTKLTFAAHALHDLKEQSPYSCRHRMADKNCSMEAIQCGVYPSPNRKIKHHYKPPNNNRELAPHGWQTPYLSKHKRPEWGFHRNKENVPQVCQNFSNPNTITQIEGQGSQRTSAATLYFDKQAVFVRGEANNDQTEMFHRLYTTNSPKVVPFKTRSSHLYSALPVDANEVTPRHAHYDPLRHGTVRDLVYNSNKITPEAQDILADIRGTVEMIIQDLMALESQILDKNFRACEAISEHLVLLPKMLIALLDHLHYSPIERELVNLTSGLSSLIEEVASDPVTVLFHLLELGYRLNELAKLFGEDLVPDCLPKLVHAIQSKLYRMKIGHVARQYLHVPQSGDHLLTSYAKSRHLLRLEEDCGCQVNLIHPEDPRAIYCPHDYRTIEVVYDEDRGKPELFFRRLNSLINPRRQCIRLVATIVRQINGREFTMKAEDAKELLSCTIRPRYRDVRAIIMSSGKRLTGMS
ncbi:hypothetical protein PHET_03315 [Paragonimus heterotremus]|uniref:Uncharacterized protein n=1 Tax=Paragonimus heterotremus TaxID=100268 RepID=A0A8J4SRE5_9TREM|nr:hypothetical protein PHET_03315 [Paragonimus heterotremus]